MSRIGDADLVKVRSLDELRAGMTVAVRELDTGKLIVGTLLGEEPLSSPVHIQDMSACAAPRVWRSTYTRWLTCFCSCFAQGRLYRLRDLDAADEMRRFVADAMDDRLRAEAHEPELVWLTTPRGP